MKQANVTITALTESSVKAVIKKTVLIRLIRKLPEYEAWKRSVFIRDRFQCQHCGKRNGRKVIIEAHHLKELSVLVVGLSSVEEALKTSLIWDISNGQTLCHSCHEKTESYPKNFCRKPSKKKKSR